MHKEIKTHTPGIKASHIYEVIPHKGKYSLAGKKFHFIGAGGIGMSGLAKLLLANQAKLSGSDQQASEVTERLCELGANLQTYHKAENIPDDTEKVVISAAIKETNPELREARKRGLKVHKYAEMLGELMSCYKGIAISGTHGKSTTSGWLTSLFAHLGLKPNYIVGADIPQFGTSSGAGTSEYFIAEACEYDRSFLNLKPQIATILNIEQDHLDYYKDVDDIIKAFTDFAQGVRPGGTVIANGQDPNVAKLIKALPDTINCQRFGIDGDFDFSARNLLLEEGCYSFDVYQGSKLLGKTKISLPGKHNVSNALAVIAMAINTGLEAEQVLANLAGFSGIDRRLMLKAKINDITVLDDYAHHPTEIKASLTAIRQKYSPKRLWCVFQPHQYSRTRFLLDDFAQSFMLADITIVPDIYFVRDSQQSKEMVNAQILVNRIRQASSEAVFIDDFRAICDHLVENAMPGDLVVTMGAGNIWKVADEYIQRLG